MRRRISTDVRWFTHRTHPFCRLLQECRGLIPASSIRGIEFVRLHCTDRILELTDEKGETGRTSDDDRGYDPLLDDELWDECG